MKKINKNLAVGLIVLVSMLASIMMNHFNLLNDFVIIERPEAVTPTPDASSSAEAGKININTASAAELKELPGIGDALSKRIIAYRESKGAFEVIEDIMKVSGIGKATFKNMSDLITVGE